MRTLGYWAGRFKTVKQWQAQDGFIDYQLIDPDNIHTRLSWAKCMLLRTEIQDFQRIVAL